MQWMQMSAKEQRAGWVSMRYIKRSMEEVFTRLNAEYPAILVTGPCQCGKTTMLQRLMSQDGCEREYVTLDDANERRLARTDPAMFLQLHRPPLLIDEVQYAPELFSCIKADVDKSHNPGAFWLIGSELFRLMDGVRESLAGRVALLYLWPLSQQEMYQSCEAMPFALELSSLSLKQKSVQPVGTPEMFERLFRGGMPALASGRYSDSTRYYSDYVSTYLERDVKAISGAIDSLRFVDFLTAAAARAAQILNFKSIADDCGIAQVTAKNWMNILERLGIAFCLHAYSNNVLKRTIKAPKLYFADTGLVCYLTRWSSPETAMSGAMSGALFENYVVAEIVKSYRNAGRDAYLYYYRDRDAKEIDLLIERDGKLWPIEIKKTAAPDRKLIRAFKVIDRSPLKVGAGAVVCMADKLGAFDEDNLIVPAWLI